MTTFFYEEVRCAELFPCPYSDIMGLCGLMLSHWGGWPPLHTESETTCVLEQYAPQTMKLVY